jgi:hypothetical protein
MEAACPTHQRRDLGLDVLHRVVDRQALVTTPPGLLMYIEISFVGVLGLQMQKLRDHKLDIPSWTGPRRK